MVGRARDMPERPKKKTLELKALNPKTLSMSSL